MSDLPQGDLTPIRATSPLSSQCNNANDVYNSTRTNMTSNNDSCGDVPVYTGPFLGPSIAGQEPGPPCDKSLKDDISPLSYGHNMHSNLYQPLHIPNTTHNTSSQSSPSPLSPPTVVLVPSVVSSLYTHLPPGLSFGMMDKIYDVRVHSESTDSPPENECPLSFPLGSLNRPPSDPQVFSESYSSSSSSPDKSFSLRSNGKKRSHHRHSTSNNNDPHNNINSSDISYDSYSDHSVDNISDDSTSLRHSQQSHTSTSSGNGSGTRTSSSISSRGKKKKRRRSSSRSNNNNLPSHFPFGVYRTAEQHRQSLISSLYLALQCDPVNDDVDTTLLSSEQQQVEEHDLQQQPQQIEQFENNKISNNSIIEIDINAITSPYNNSIVPVHHTDTSHRRPPRSNSPPTISEDSPNVLAQESTSDVVVDNQPIPTVIESNGLPIDVTSHSPLSATCGIDTDNNNYSRTNMNTTSNTSPLSSFFRPISNNSHISSCLSDRHPSDGDDDDDSDDDDSVQFNSKGDDSDYSRFTSLDTMLHGRHLTLPLSDDSLQPKRPSLVTPTFGFSSNEWKYLTTFTQDSDHKCYNPDCIFQRKNAHHFASLSSKNSIHDQSDNHEHDNNNKDIPREDNIQTRYPIDKDRMIDLGGSTLHIPVYNSSSPSTSLLHPSSHYITDPLSLFDPMHSSFGPQLKFRNTNYSVRPKNKLGQVKVLKEHLVPGPRPSAEKTLHYSRPAYMKSTDERQHPFIQERLWSILSSLCLQLSTRSIRRFNRSSRYDPVLPSLSPEHSPSHQPLSSHPNQKKSKSSQTQFDSSLAPPHLLEGFSQILSTDTQPQPFLTKVSPDSNDGNSTTAEAGASDSNTVRPSPPRPITDPFSLKPPTRVGAVESFTCVPLHHLLLTNLFKSRFLAPFTLQQWSLGSLLSGFDTMLLGPKSCGKSLAILIPIIQHILVGFDNGTFSQSADPTTTSKTIDIATNSSSSIASPDFLNTFIDLPQPTVLLSSPVPLSADAVEFVPSGISLHNDDIPQSVPEQSPDNVPVCTPYAVIICPTKDRVLHIMSQANLLIENTPIKICGVFNGPGYVEQYHNISTKRPHIIVCTVGRFHDFLSKGYITMKYVEHFVIDGLDDIVNDNNHRNLKNIIKLYNIHAPPSHLDMSNILYPKPTKAQRNNNNNKSLTGNINNKSPAITNPDNSNPPSSQLRYQRRIVTMTHSKYQLQSSSRPDNNDVDGDDDTDPQSTITDSHVNITGIRKMTSLFLNPSHHRIAVETNPPIDVQVIHEVLVHINDITYKPQALISYIILALTKSVLPVLCYVKTRETAEMLHTELAKLGLRVASLHGSKTSKQRNTSLYHFLHGSIRILFVTDILTRRGALNRIACHVLNYDLPQTVEMHFERAIRRKADHYPITGTLCSFVTNSDVDLMLGLVSLRTDTRQPIPPWLISCAPQPAHRVRINPRLISLSLSDTVKNRRKMHSTRRMTNFEPYIIPRKNGRFNKTLANVIRAQLSKTQLNHLASSSRQRYFFPIIPPPPFGVMLPPQPPHSLLIPPPPPPPPPLSLAVPPPPPPTPPLPSQSAPLMTPDLLKNLPPARPVESELHSNRHLNVLHGLPPPPPPSPPLFSTIPTVESSVPLTSPQMQHPPPPPPPDYLSSPSGSMQLPVGSSSCSLSVSSSSLSHRSKSSAVVSVSTSSKASHRSRSRPAPTSSGLNFVPAPLPPGDILSSLPPPPPDSVLSPVDNLKSIPPPPPASIVNAPSPQPGAVVATTDIMKSLPPPPPLDSVLSAAPSSLPPSHSLSPSESTSSFIPPPPPPPASPDYKPYTQPQNLIFSQPPPPPGYLVNPIGSGRHHQKQRNDHQLRQDNHHGRKNQSRGHSGLSTSLLPPSSQHRSAQTSKDTVISLNDLFPDSSTDENTSVSLSSSIATESQSSSMAAKSLPPDPVHTMHDDLKNDAPVTFDEDIPIAHIFDNNGTVPVDQSPLGSTARQIILPLDNQITLVQSITPSSRRQRSYSSGSTPPYPSRSSTDSSHSPPGLRPASASPEDKHSHEPSYSPQLTPTTAVAPDIIPILDVSHPPIPSSSSVIVSLKSVSKSTSQTHIIVASSPSSSSPLSTHLELEIPAGPQRSELDDKVVLHDDIQLSPSSANVPVSAIIVPSTSSSIGTRSSGSSSSNVPASVSASVVPVPKMSHGKAGRKQDKTNAPSTEHTARSSTDAPRPLLHCPILVPTPSESRSIANTTATEGRDSFNGTITGTQSHSFTWGTQSAMASQSPHPCSTSIQSSSASGQSPNPTSASIRSRQGQSLSSHRVQPPQSKSVQLSSSSSLQDANSPLSSTASLDQSHRTKPSSPTATPSSKGQDVVPENVNDLSSGQYRSSELVRSTSFSPDHIPHPPGPHPLHSCPHDDPSYPAPHPQNQNVPPYHNRSPPSHGGHYPPDYAYQPYPTRPYPPPHDNPHQHPPWPQHPPAQYDAHGHPPPSYFVCPYNHHHPYPSHPSHPPHPSHYGPPIPPQRPRRRPNNRPRPHRPPDQGYGPYNHPHHHPPDPHRRAPYYDGSGYDEYGPLPPPRGQYKGGHGYDDGYNGYDNGYDDGYDHDYDGYDDYDYGPHPDYDPSFAPHPPPQGYFDRRGPPPSERRRPHYLGGPQFNGARQPPRRDPRDHRMPEPHDRPAFFSPPPPHQRSIPHQRGPGHDAHHEHHIPYDNHPGYQPYDPHPPLPQPQSPPPIVSPNDHPLHNESSHSPRHQPRPFTAAACHPSRPSSPVRDNSQERPSFTSLDTRDTTASENRDSITIERENSSITALIVARKSENIIQSVSVDNRVHHHDKNTDNNGTVKNDRNRNNHQSNAHSTQTSGSLQRSLSRHVPSSSLSFSSRRSGPNQNQFNQQSETINSSTRSSSHHRGGSHNRNNRRGSSAKRDNDNISDAK